MSNRTWIALLALFGLALTLPAASPPVVPGFQRFHGSGQGDKIQGGRLLLGELNCGSCHQGSEAVRKPALVLDYVGSRVRVGYLRRYLNDPHAIKPGTTMPDLLSGDSEKGQKVEALVHFLASTGTPRHERFDLKLVAAGRDHYSRIGCVACHGPRDANGDPVPTTAHVVPLGDLKKKYTIASLSAFLDNPHDSRPGGRMPKILSGKEPKEVATYLLQGIKGTPVAGRGTANYSYYEGNWEKIPAFAKLKPRWTGVAPAFDVGTARRNNNYALRFEGVFRADRPGDYRFSLGSDDGANLLIDGKVVVDNDGIHAMVWKDGTVRLNAGVHKVSVGFFQVGGGAELEARIEGPGLAHQELASLVAPTEADLDRRPENSKTDDEDAIQPQPKLIAEGKNLFATLGCANCHSLKVDNVALVSRRSAPGLATLRPQEGCLSAAPARGTPLFGLSDLQRDALTAALKTPKPGSNPAESIAHTLLTFNCYACHVRAKIGGPEQALNASFTTTQPEMGDEARIPPTLDGVGGKFQENYLRNLLDKGVHDRPYMQTRMPGFGTANVGHLVSAFSALDPAPTAPMVAFPQLQPTQIRATGRRLVGTEAFGCIKCHTFGGQKAEGTQGIDMLLLPKRLRREWFQAYVADPQKVRPGTRMPSGFDKGMSLLPKILDGTAASQIEAMWVYLSEGSAARAPVGLQRQSMPLTPANSALIYRNFIEGGGTRAIAVGYPEKIHLAFDANELRLSTLWQGAFLDAARHWTDRGVGFEGPLGDNILQLPKGPGLAILGAPEDPWPTVSARALGHRFLGYKLAADDRPTFLYSVGNVHIEDLPTPVPGPEAALKRTLTFKGEATSPALSLRIAVGKKIEPMPEGWFRIDGTWKVRLRGAKTQVHTLGGVQEIRTHVTLAQGSAVVVEEIAW